MRCTTRHKRLTNYDIIPEHEVSVPVHRHDHDDCAYEQSNTTLRTILLRHALLRWEQRSLLLHVQAYQIHRLPRRDATLWYHVDVSEDPNLDIV